MNNDSLLQENKCLFYCHQFGNRFISFSPTDSVFEIEYRLQTFTIFCSIFSTVSVTWFLIATRENLQVIYRVVPLHIHCLHLF